MRPEIRAWLDTLHHIEGHKRSGVYAIVHVEDGHRYVGSSVCMIKRWKRHLDRLYADDHHSPHLQAAWKLYGGESFVFAILEFVEPAALKSVEQRYLLERAEYNVSKDTNAPMRGLVRSAEHCRRISEARKGQAISEEQKQQLREFNARRREERRIWMEAHPGEKPPPLNHYPQNRISRAKPKAPVQLPLLKIRPPRSEGAKQKTRETWARKQAEREQWMRDHPGEQPPPFKKALSGPENPLFGKQHSESMRKLISERTREAMQAKKTYLSEYQTQHPSRGMLGKHHSEETRQKLADRAREQHARKGQQAGSA